MLPDMWCPKTSADCCYFGWYHSSVHRQVPSPNVVVRGYNYSNLVQRTLRRSIVNLQEVSVGSR